MLVIRTETHKMLVRNNKQGLHLQKQSDQGLHFLSRPFLSVFKILKLLISPAQRFIKLIQTGKYFI